MFNRRKRLLAMLDNIQPTSKTSLKMQCLQLSKGNVKDAAELYDYLTAGIDTLPDFDPVKPTFLQSTKIAADGILNWVKENKEPISEGIDFIKGIISKRAAATSAKAPLTPIN